MNPITHLYLSYVTFPADQYSVFRIQIPIEACKYEKMSKNERTVQV
jgi:hypothetical protein